MHSTLFLSAAFIRMKIPHQRNWCYFIQEQNLYNGCIVQLSDVKCFLDVSFSNTLLLAADAIKQKNVFVLLVEIYPDII